MCIGIWYQLRRLCHLFGDIKIFANDCHKTITDRRSKCAIVTSFIPLDSNCLPGFPQSSSWQCLCQSAPVYQTRETWSQGWPTHQLFLTLQSQPNNPAKQVHWGSGARNTCPVRSTIIQMSILMIQGMTGETGGWWRPRNKTRLVCGRIPLQLALPDRTSVTRMVSQCKRNPGRHLKAPHYSKAIPMAAGSPAAGPAPGSIKALWVITIKSGIRSVVAKLVLVKVGAPWRTPKNNIESVMQH